MNTIKYILIHIEIFMMIASLILSSGAAESSMWGWTYALIFAPFVWGYLTNFEKQIHFYEVYSRARNIYLNSNK